MVQPRFGTHAARAKDLGLVQLLWCSIIVSSHQQSLHERLA